MKHLIFCLPIIFLLTGCETTKPVIVKTQYMVVDVPSELYRCDNVRIPDPEKITNAQVATLIKQLKLTNNKCMLSQEAIKRYLEEAKKTIEQ